MKNLKLLFVPLVLLLSSFLLHSLNDLPTAESDLFAGAGQCAQCHYATDGVLQTSGGLDVSPTTGWRSGMMANSAKDPLWRAKVSAESLAHPHLQNVIEDKCNTCHSPMGRTEAHYHGADYFTFQEAMDDTLSQDGVSCTLCHQIRSDNLGTEESFSGNYMISDAREIFGPYENPFANAMINIVNYAPLKAEHIGESSLCATCHTLFTPFVDDDGNVAGYFPEQTPYLEWLNSNFPEENASCQSCHMPEVREDMKISASPPFLSTQRNPVYEHEFVGGNAFMNRLIRDNAAELGANATADQFDTTARRAVEMLQSAVALELQHSVSNDSLFIDVLVSNLSGHKFPTGFPSRRAWIYLKISDENQQLLFESGGYDENGRINGLAEPYESHHNIIRDENQVQIYQSLMQDVNGNLTYTLLRGAEYLKDNRIPPQGFVSSAPDIEPIAVHGAASADPDFNKSAAGIEGSGADIVHFILPLPEGMSFLEIEAKICYQTVSPNFVDDLDQYASSYVDDFQGFYQSSDNLPQVIDSETVEVELTGIQDNQPENELLIFPNPLSHNSVLTFSLSTPKPVRLDVYDLKGRNKYSEAIFQAGNGLNKFPLEQLYAELRSGVYFLTLCCGDEQKKIRFLKL